MSRRRPLSRLAALPVVLAAGALVLPSASLAKTSHPAHRASLHVTSVTPSGGAVSGDAPITVHYSAKLPALAAVRKPTIAPTLAGHWTQPNATTLVYHPSSAELPFAKVTVTVPAATRDAAGAKLSRAASHTFTVKDGSATRLSQLLAQLGYLPEHFVGAGRQPARTDNAAQRRAAFAPPRGRLVLGKGWPSALAGLVSGQDSTVLKGAVMAFESQHGLSMDGVAGANVWSALIAARLHGSTNQAGYTYALASEHEPESLTIYHDGRVVAHSLANTGAPGSGTQTGTYPVYERLRSQIMRGTNPGGGTYADPVQYVAYFHGGDAVHYIARADYGIPQSLGCVELPLAPAARIWPYLTYGTLVTVAP